MRQEFTMEIEKTARAVVNEVHTSLPGEIVSFDTDRCTATVRPIGKFATSDGKILEYPKISEVPVMFPYSMSGGVGIAFPVKAGDNCLILVSEVELDEWRTGAEAEGSLRFDLSNAVAIPGLLYAGCSLIAEANRQNAVVVGTRDVVLCVSESGITARGDLKVEGNISYTGSLNKA